MYSSTHVPMYSCIRKRMYSCAYALMYSCTHIRMYSCTHVLINFCAHIRMYSCTLILLYLCTHVLILRPGGWELMYCEDSNSRLWLIREKKAMKNMFIIYIRTQGVKGRKINPFFFLL